MVLWFYCHTKHQNYARKTTEMPGKPNFLEPKQKLKSITKKRHNLKFLDFSLLKSPFEKAINLTWRVSKNSHWVDCRLRVKASDIIFSILYQGSDFELKVCANPPQKLL